MTTNNPKSSLQARLPLPKGALIINYDIAAQVYFNYELTPRDVLSKLAFLGAITEVEVNGNRLPTTGDTLQQAGIGRKNLGGNGDQVGLMACVLACDMERFEILDGAPSILESEKLRFDKTTEIIFENSNADIFQDSIWGKEITEQGRIQAHINDILKYCKINGKPLTKEIFELPISEGGIGWLLAAFLLLISTQQGKFEFTIPTPL